MTASFNTLVSFTWYYRLTNTLRIFLSRPLKFVIGEERVPMMVHEDAIATQSPALASLVQGKMSESLTAEVRWDDVDKATFLRFVQFIYSGDYSTPEYPIKRVVQILSEENSTNATVGTSEQATQWPDESLHARYNFEERWGVGPPLKKGKKGKPTPRDAPTFPTSTSFNSLRYPAPRTSSVFTNSREPVISDGHNDKNVLLYHAALYILADKWGVDALKQLTLHKLHQALIALRLDMSNFQDLVDLTLSVYMGECTYESENGIDKLRELICLYIVANGKLTSEHSAFAALLKEEGALASDLWKIAGPKLQSAQSY